MRISDWSSDVCSSDLTGATAAAAAQVGKRVAAAATKAGVTKVVFDRGGFLFHGRVKALADAARAGRPAERRVGQEGVSTCRHRLAQSNYKTKPHSTDRTSNVRYDVHVVGKKNR